EENAVPTAARRRFTDRVGDDPVSLILDRSAGPGLRRDGHLNFGALLLGDRQITAENGSGPPIGRDRLLPHRRPITPLGEALNVSGNRRKGVGLVLHHRQEQAHDPDLLWKVLAAQAACRRRSTMRAMIEAPIGRMPSSTKKPGLCRGTSPPWPTRQ